MPDKKIAAQETPAPVPEEGFMTGQIDNEDLTKEDVALAALKEASEKSLQRLDNHIQELNNRQTQPPHDLSNMDQILQLYIDLFSQLSSSIRKSYIQKLTKDLDSTDLKTKDYAVRWLTAYKQREEGLQQAFQQGYFTSAIGLLQLAVNNLPRLTPENIWSYDEAIKKHFESEINRSHSADTEASAPSISKN